MGGRGASFTTAREIVGQYELTDITDSKSKIVSFFRDIDKNGGIRIRTAVFELMKRPERSKSRSQQCRRHGIWQMSFLKEWSKGMNNP